MSADSSTIGTWLAHVYAGRPGFISVCSDADGWTGRRFTTDEEGIAAAAAYAVKLDGQRPMGIYTQVTTLRERPARGRGGEDLAHALSHLWADGDFGTVGHKPGLDDLPAPPDADAVVKVVAESGLPEPTGWTCSGGGYNPVWMLADTHTIQDEADRVRIKRLTSAWQTILAAQAHRHGWSWDSEVGNLDRLMRLPGTVNRKEGFDRETYIGPGGGPRYTLDELIQAADQLADEARQVMDQAARQKQARKAARLGNPAAPPRTSRAPRPASGDGPFDVLADMLDFADLLQPAGFTYLGVHSDGRHKWLRPAAGGDRPSSAYSLLCDDHVAVNFSDRADLPVGAQPGGQKLTVPTLYAWLNYGGNASEAAADIMRAAGGRPAGPAAQLPAAVLAEVNRRCLDDDGARMGPAAWAEDAPPPPDPDSEETEGWASGPVRRRGRLPEDFWAARPVLQHIRQAAHARARSADIVLGGVLARVASLVPPELQADTGVGSPASLNLLVNLLGPSGSGKSSAAWIPRQLITPPPGLDYLDELPLGTGEGIAEAFMGEKAVETGEIYASGPNKGKPKTERIRTQARANALFYADEGESLTKQLFGRNGATIGEAVRRAWNGGTIGQFNGQKVNTRVINGGTYSLGIVVGFQPETALPLLDDAAAGTPQRFLWVSSTDPTIPEDIVKDPGPLDLALIRHGFGNNPKITFASDILREIRRDDWERATGAVKLPPLDSHKPLMRIKLASLLAILANRTHVTVEDWQLALVMWETSCELRDALIEFGTRHQAEEAEKRTRAHVDREVRAHAAKVATERDVERVARRAVKLVREANGMTRGALNRATAHRDRRMLGMAVDLAEARGWLVVEGDDLSPGDSMPA